MRIAIIGGGISGLVAAYQLQDQAEVSVFEAKDYIGGHTHTVDVQDGDVTLGVDTGFIVYNNETYPGFSRLLEKLNVATQPSEMSFALSDPRSGFAYAAPRLKGLFAHKSNLLRPAYLKMLWDIVRFSTHGPAYLRDCMAEKTIADFLDSGGYSKAFRDDYLAPMISAIWSSGSDDVAALPAKHFLHFFENHGLMRLRNRPQWRVIKGGSRNYIAPLIEGFRNRVHANAPVQHLIRKKDQVTLTMAHGEALSFDHVVLAVHSNIALQILADATDREKEILGAMPYQANAVTLHTDTSVLPENRNAWASWNYRKRPDSSGAACLTYDMNRLQSLQAKRDYLVSLNQDELIAPEQVLGQYEYSHPRFSAASVSAQARHREISGHHRTHYCGAYWGYGFHEDGVQSALKACTWFNAAALRS